MTATTTLSLAEATELVTKAFAANGVPQSVALSVAKALVAAEAEGQVGHGFSRIADYIAQVRSGKIVADATVETSRPATTTVQVDAGYGFAYPALDAGISAGLDTAKQHGTATVGIRRSHHCGALSVQVDRIAREGFVGLMMANSPVAIAPWGAKTPLYGTNPIAFAAPRSDAGPLVIDLSLSRVARGKVMNAKRRGETIPDSWALDADGNPTTDPEAALQGSMQPIGGAKGTALALMVETLCAVMTGAAFSKDAGSFFSADGPKPGVGQFLMILRPPDGTDAFADRLQELLDQIEAMDGARLPGARRAAAIEAAEANGIAVPTQYVDEVRRLAAV